MTTLADIVLLGRFDVAEDPAAVREAMASEHGALLLVDKPYADTSFYVVNKIRKALSRFTGIHRLKCGHAGTLDPLATGLLMIATRRKTRSLAVLVGLEKTYLLRMRFGITSPSFDLERPIEIIGNEEHLTPDIVREAVLGLRGEHLQVPPVYSAIKQQGRPVYLKARAGHDVTMVPREIVIHEVEIVEINLPEVTFRVRVSKGTYIRSLVGDLAATLGTAGLLVDLQREAVGDWTVREALPLTEVLSLLSTGSAVDTATGPTTGSEELAPTVAAGGAEAPAP